MTEGQRVSHAFGLLHAASLIVNAAVTATKDRDGEEDPDVRRINLDLIKVVSRYADKIEDYDKKGSDHDTKRPTRAD